MSERKTIVIIAGPNGSDGPKRAKSPMEEAEMLASGEVELVEQWSPSLKEIRPFIELPDLVFDPQVKLDGPHLLGINVGARLGMLGDPIPLPATAQSVAKLAEMKVEVVDHFSPEMFNHPDRLALLAGVSPLR